MDTTIYLIQWAHLAQVQIIKTILHSSMLTQLWQALSLIKNIFKNDKKAPLISSYLMIYTADK